MSESHQPVKLKLSFDESRLVRLFRCMSTLERTILLCQLHQQLMKTHSVLPELERYAKWEEIEAEEMSEHVNDRLYSAHPYQTEIANAHDFTLDLSEIAWGCDFAEDVLGTEESQTQDFVESLTMAYFDAHRDTGMEPCFNPNDDEQVEYLNEESVNYLRFWRENIVRGIEQSVARKAKDSPRSISPNSKQ